MLQTILIPKKSFSLKKAFNWLEKHKYHSNKVDVDKNFYRFRQSEPKKGRYYTKVLPNKIELVFVIKNKKSLKTKKK
jgi:hypothetical protein